MVYPFWADLYQKIPILEILGAVLPNFKVTVAKFGMRVRTWDTLPRAKFCKNRLRRCTPFGQMYTKKITISAIWGVVSPHFKSDNGEIWPQSTNLGYPPPALNFVKIAQGDLSLEGNFYQKFEIFAIFSYLSPYFCTDNVEILRMRTDALRNPSTKQIFVKIAQVACRYCIASRLCILFLVD